MEYLLKLMGFADSDWINNQVSNIVNELFSLIKQPKLPQILAEKGKPSR